MQFLYSRHFGVTNDAKQFVDPSTVFTYLSYDGGAGMPTTGGIHLNLKGAWARLGEFGVLKKRCWERRLGENLLGFDIIVLSNVKKFDIILLIRSTYVAYILKIVLFFYVWILYHLLYQTEDLNEVIWKEFVLNALISFQQNLNLRTTYQLKIMLWNNDRNFISYKD